MADPNYNQNATYNAGVNTAPPAVTDNSAFGGPNATQASAANAAVIDGTPVSASAPIDVSKISTVPNFNLPPAPTDLLSSNASTLVSIPTIASITGQENTLTPAEQTNKALTDKMTGLSDQFAGKTIATTNAYNAAGLPALNAQFTDLNSQIATLKNQASAIPLQDQNDAAGRGITAAGLAPIDSANLRNNTIKALGLSSLASALQGNIATAQAQADAAVKAQFDPIEQQIAYVQNAIAANKDQMTKEEKTQADTITAQLTERQTQIGYQREDMSTAHAWAATAVTNNPGNAAAQLAAQQALGIDFTQPGALQKAMALLAPYQSDPQAFAKNAAEIALTRAQTNDTNASAGLKNAQAKLYASDGSPASTGTTGAQFSYNGQTLDASTASPTDLISFAMQNGTLDASILPKSATSPVRQDIIAVLRSNPNFNFIGNKANIAAAATAARTQAKASANLQMNLGTINDHINSVQTALNAIPQTDVNGINTLQYNISRFTNPTEYAAFTKFYAEASALREEVAKALGGGAATDSSRQSAAQIIPEDITPAGFQSVVSAPGGIQSLIQAKLANSSTPVQVANYNGNSSSGTTVMTGPDGNQYNVPNDKVAAFKAAGGH